ncbi:MULTISPECIES: SMI1/KNR4 family protein [Niastella]|uniref:SMI1/KNR4 family protein n=1 Tax=Niastella soli TaxID=2821487 RepID=A0ABS3YYV1_9BACT|nr:SMI1/KNR4 family protein [Niastella soli]MBO9203107.1 SMI1/KNR4 family protein [Niastella soli]
MTIKDIINRIKTDKTRLGITLYAPASSSDIVKFEEILHITLPDDIKTFYSFSNGFESDEDMFRIIPLEEIVDNIKDRNSFTESNGDFHIAEYMIYCDTWTLHVDSNDSSQYKIYNKTLNTIVLTNSFSEFLNVFLNKGVFDGLYSWRENLANKTK